jgi:MarR family transcriptional regulator for hemolysin
MEGELSQAPIGRDVAMTAKLLDRAFGAALGEHGGTIPSWLVLLALKQQPHRTQQDIAKAVGIGGPTLTHHLDAMEAAGLVVRSRDGADRRAVHVEITDVGAAMFERLRETSRAFDAQLREGLSETEVDQGRALLRRLRENVSD